MPLAKNREVDHFVDQETREFEVAASTHIYKGAVVSLKTDGYARGLVAGEEFIGIAYSESDNTTGANGATKVRIYTQGDFVHALSGATITDLGRPVFATADDTLSFVGNANSYVGVVEGLDSSGVIVLRIDPNRRLIKTATHAVEDLAAGADIAARSVHSFGKEGWIIAARVVNQATAAAGIDAGNTCTVTLAIDAGNVVVEVFDDVTAFPAANAAQDLGTLTNTHAAAGDVLTLAVLNGATADPGPFLVEIEYL